MTASATARIVDSADQPVSLGAELGRGGEGIVYAIADRPDAVAKLYHEPPGAAKAEKLAAMATLATERLLRLTAWPLGTLHREAGGPVAGLLMPRIDGYKAIHTLYSPKSRLAAFPQAGYPFLVHAAANAARAFAVIHDHGHVIGDVNHGNLVVSPQATGKLIDCDSFQIAAGERLFRCEVGVATHTPPELQGKSFRKVTRTINHDAFGLAVIVFQLLFMGRHPFSGAYSGPGEMPLERSISEFRFAYSQHATDYQMRPPPATATLTTVTPEVAILFERAFAAEGAQGSRPAPQEWIGALTALGQALKPCKESRAHHYLKSLPECPWCRIERRAGVLLFGLAAYDVTKAQANFNLTAVWEQIVAVSPPLALPWPQHTVAPSAEARQRGRAEAASRKLFAILAPGLLLLWLLATRSVGALIGGVFVLILLSLLERANARRWRRKYRKRVEVVQGRYRAITTRWEEQASTIPFERVLRELAATRSRYEGLPATRQSRLDALGKQVREQQLQHFLDTFDLARADIDGIGPARVATLQSYGVETAADVEAKTIKAIPGFGPAYTERLLEWRRTVESRFRFDAARGIARAEIDAVDWGIEAERGELERALLHGPALLDQTKSQIAAAREALWPELEAAAQQLAQADADRKALS